MGRRADLRTDRPISGRFLIVFGITSKSGKQDGQRPGLDLNFQGSRGRNCNPFGIPGVFNMPGGHVAIHLVGAGCFGFDANVTSAAVDQMR